MHTCPMVTVLVPHVGGPIIPACCPTVLIGGLPAARVTDMCTCVGPPDVIVQGSATVFIGGLPAARIGDMTAHGGVIVTGLPTVLIGDSGGSGGGGGGAQSETGAAGGGAGGAPGGQPNQVPTTYGSIKLEGTPAERLKMIKALDQIKATTSGAAMLKSIDRSGQQVTIKATTSGNGALPLNRVNAQRKADGTPGSGSGSTVNFNPDRGTIGDGSEPWMTRPPAVGLAHELVHADHSAHGTNDFTPAGEDMAVGVPPYDKQPFTENKIRNEWKPKQPQRPHY